jgi:hypothetical protein
MKDYEDCDTEIVIASALLHDVGIKTSEEKLGYNNGRTQERFGPPEAERLLRSVAFPQAKIEKVKPIIGNPHSPLRSDCVELEILKTADRAVNTLATLRFAKAALACLRGGGFKPPTWPKGGGCFAPFGNPIIGFPRSCAGAYESQSKRESLTRIYLMSGIRPRYERTRILYLQGFRRPMKLSLISIDF